MVRTANTKEEKQRVYDYLVSKGTRPATNDLYYTEDDKGNITGAFGIEVKVCIEPLQAEHKFSFYEMIKVAVAIIKCSGVSKMHCFTNNAKLINIAQSKYGAIQWGNNLTELMAILKK